MGSGKTKTLLSDTLVFAIGNFAVKGIQFVLLPLYTASMTASEYGVAELLNNANELLFPVVCLGLYEALFRFSLDDDVPREKMVTGAVAVWAAGIFVSTVLAVAIGLASDMRLALLVAGLLGAHSLRMLVAQFARGSGFVRAFAWSGVLNALLLLVGSFFLVGVFKTGVFGYLGSMIASSTFSLLYLAWKTSFFRYVGPHFDRTCLRDMLAYSLPLIPNSLAWWFTNLSNRYVVQFFCGSATAGLFSAAGKLPGVVNMFTQVFQQAWQISATKAMRDRDRGKFYESVFKGYSICVFVAASLAIGAAGLLARFLLLGDFYAAKSFIPLLMIGALFNGLSSYLGAFYAAFKESGKLLFSTAVGGALNVVVSIALTWQLGAWGSAVGFALSNFAICVIRLRGSREHVGAGAREGWFWGGILIVSVQTCLATLDVTRDTLLPCVMIVVLVVFEALANKTALLAAIGKALGRKRA